VAPVTRLDPMASLEYGDMAPPRDRAAAGRSDPVDEPELVRDDWADFAACRGMGTSQAGIKEWFPGPGGSQTIGRNICSQCPVSAQCGSFAEENEIEWGIWGGDIRRRKTRSK